jgi:hypothetical protein
LAKHKFANTIVTVLFDNDSFSLIEIKTVKLSTSPKSANDISMKTSHAPNELGSLVVKYTKIKLRKSSVMSISLVMFTSVELGGIVVSENI